MHCKKGIVSVQNPGRSSVAIRPARHGRLSWNTAKTAKPMKIGKAEKAPPVEDTDFLHFTHQADMDRMIL